MNLRAEDLSCPSERPVILSSSANEKTACWSMVLSVAWNKLDERYASRRKEEWCSEI